MRKFFLSMILTTAVAASLPGKGVVGAVDVCCDAPDGVLEPAMDMFAVLPMMPEADSVTLSGEEHLSLMTDINPPTILAELNGAVRRRTPLGNVIIYWGYSSLAALLAAILLALIRYGVRTGLRLARECSNDDAEREADGSEHPGAGGTEGGEGGERERNRPTGVILFPADAEEDGEEYVDDNLDSKEAEESVFFRVGLMEPFSLKCYSNHFEIVDSCGKVFLTSYGSDLAPGLSARILLLLNKDKEVVGFGPGSFCLRRAATGDYSICPRSEEEQPVFRLKMRTFYDETFDEGLNEELGAEVIRRMCTPERFEEIGLESCM